MLSLKSSSNKTHKKTQKGLCFSLAGGLSFALSVFSPFSVRFQSVISSKRRLARQSRRAGLQNKTGNETDGTDETNGTCLLGDRNRPTLQVRRARQALQETKQKTFLCFFVCFVGPQKCLFEAKSHSKKKKNGFFLKSVCFFGTKRVYYVSMKQNDG